MTEPAVSDGSKHLKSREVLLHALVLVAVLCCMFPGVFLRGEIIGGADLLYDLPVWRLYVPDGWTRPHNPLMADIISAFHPFYVHTRAALDRGEWPLWNPAECGGMPLLANCQSAVLYPPRLLHAFLDLALAGSLYVLLKLWLCGMVAYLCGRGIGFRPVGARLLSLGWMLCSYNQFWACWPLPDVSAWLPLLFLGVELALAGKAMRSITALGAGGAMIILAGHPETAFAMSFDLAIYFLLRFCLAWHAEGRIPWRPTAICAVGWCVALCFSVVQWLPFVEYVLNSYTLAERHEEKFIATSALRLNAMVGLWVPRFFGTEANLNYWGDQDGNRYALYPGIMLWIGAALHFARRRELGAEKARLIALAVSVAVAFLLVFDAPTLSALHNLPGFASLRKNYHVGFALFGLAVLGARGMEAWLERPRPVRGLLWSLITLIPAALIVFGAWRFYGNLIHYMKMTDFILIRILITSAVAALALGFLAAGGLGWRPRWMGALLAVLLAADLLAAGWRVNPTFPRKQIYPKTALFTYLQEQKQPLRIEPGAAFGAPGITAGFGVQEWMGYDGIYPLRILRFTRALETDVWNAMEPTFNIRLYLRHADMESGVIPKPLFDFDNTERFRYLTTLDDVKVYENIQAYPRAYLAGPIREIPDFDALVQAAASPDYDPLREVITDRAPAGLKPERPLDTPGKAEIIDYGYTRVTIDADAPDTCTLVLADAYFPGWNAYVDGAPAEQFPAYSIFRGVVLPKGPHTVEFRYEPWSFRIGMWITVLSLLAGAVWSVGRLCAARKRTGN